MYLIKNYHLPIYIFNESEIIKYSSELNEKLETKRVDSSSIDPNAFLFYRKENQFLPIKPREFINRSSKIINIGTNNDNYQKANMVIQGEATYNQSLSEYCDPLYHQVVDSYADAVTVTSRMIDWATEMGSSCVTEVEQTQCPANTLDILIKCWKACTDLINCCESSEESSEEPDPFNPAASPQSNSVASARPKPVTAGANGPSSAENPVIHPIRNPIRNPVAKSISKINNLNLVFLYGVIL